MHVVVTAYDTQTDKNLVENTVPQRNSRLFSAVAALPRGAATTFFVVSHADYNDLMRCWTVDSTCIPSTLTLWRRLLSYGYSYKASCASPG